MVMWKESSVLSPSGEDGERRVRVVIADDRVCSRDGLRALLRTWPEIEVVGEACNGEEAMDRARACQPDVMLMDVRMPVMDGLTATRAIKRRWPSVRVVVLTIYDGAEDDALAAGADAFVAKGSPPHELLKAILG